MPKPDAEARLALAAFKLLAQTGWRKMTLASVARAAKLPLPAALAIASSKPMLIGVVLRRIGAETVLQYRADEAAQSARERVFEVCMTWFEVLGSRKDAMRALHDGLRSDPLMLISVRREIVAACELLLALAEADWGRSPRLTATGVAGVLLRAVPVWLSDDDGMGKTMAQLDGDLRRLERFLWPLRGVEKPDGKASRRRRKNR
jgi:AcrR family transcriptional regulator